MERENRIMFARKHDLQRKKRAYVDRKRALLVGEPTDEEVDEERDEEDPVVAQEVQEELEADARTTYRVYEEEDEEDG